MADIVGFETEPGVLCLSSCAGIPPTISSVLAVFSFVNGVALASAATISLVFMGSAVFVGPCEGPVAEVGALLLEVPVVPDTAGLAAVGGLMEDAAAGMVSGDCKATDGSWGV